MRLLTTVLGTVALVAIIATHRLPAPSTSSEPLLCVTPGAVYVGDRKVTPPRACVL